jgi:hypothetical protein
MTTKTIKSEDKVSSKAKSIRISFENQKRAIKILASANKKKIGRKIKFDQVLEIALGLLTDDHIALIQDRSLTSENKKELLRQKYIVEVGPITKDEFTGFMMTDEFAAFRRGQFQAQKSA